MENKSAFPMTDFNFDHWMKLASEHPDAFERHRLDAIEEFFGQLPQQRRSRLQHLQWRIDMEIRRHHSPLGSCIRIYQLMMESLDRQKAALDGLLCSETQELSTPSAKVIPFTPRNQS